MPVTKLGRLVKEGKVGSIEEIFLFSIPVKEAEIIAYVLKDKLQDEVMKIMPVQKQSSAGQRTRFKAFVAVGDGAGHIGLGVKCSSEVATAIRGAILAAKLNVAPWFAYVASKANCSDGPSRLDFDFAMHSLHALWLAPAALTKPQLSMRAQDWIQERVVRASPRVSGAQRRARKKHCTHAPSSLF